MPASSSASANAPADDEFVAWYRRDFASTTSYEDDLNELLSDIFAILQEPLDLGDNSTDDDDARVLERWGTWDERKWERWKVTPAELETIKRMRECLRVVEDPEKCRVDHDATFTPLPFLHDDVNLSRISRRGRPFFDLDKHRPPTSFDSTPSVLGSIHKGALDDVPQDEALTKLEVMPSADRALDLRMSGTPGQMQALKDVVLSTRASRAQSDTPTSLLVEDCRVFEASWNELERIEWPRAPSPPIFARPRAPSLSPPLDFNPMLEGLVKGEEAPSSSLPGINMQEWNKLENIKPFPFSSSSQHETSPRPIWSSPPLKSSPPSGDVFTLDPILFPRAPIIKEEEIDELDDDLLRLDEPYPCPSDEIDELASSTSEIDELDSDPDVPGLARDIHLLRPSTALATPKPPAESVADFLSTSSPFPPDPSNLLVQSMAPSNHLPIPPTSPSPHLNVSLADFSSMSGTIWALQPAMGLRSLSIDLSWQAYTSPSGGRDLWTVFGDEGEEGEKEEMEVAREMRTKFAEAREESDSESLLEGVVEVTREEEREEEEELVPRAPLGGGDGKSEMEREETPGCETVATEPSAIADSDDVPAEEDEPAEEDDSRATDEDFPVVKTVGAWEADHLVDNDVCISLEDQSTTVGVERDWVEPSNVPLPSLPQGDGAATDAAPSFIYPSNMGSSLKREDESDNGCPRDFQLPAAPSTSEVAPPPAPSATPTQPNPSPLPPPPPPSPRANDIPIPADASPLPLPARKWSGATSLSRFLSAKGQARLVAPTASPSASSPSLPKPPKVPLPLAPPPLPRPTSFPIPAFLLSPPTELDPPTIYRIVVSTDLLQMTHHYQALRQASIALVERPRRFEPEPGRKLEPHLIVDGKTCVIFIRLIKIVGNVVRVEKEGEERDEAVVTTLERLACGFDRILVVLEEAGGEEGKGRGLSYTPPVVAALKLLRETIEGRLEGCRVEVALSKDPMDSAGIVRRLVGWLHAKEELGYDEESRVWLSDEASETEQSLLTIPDLNSISAAAIASCSTISDFLAMPLQDRINTFKEVCSPDRMLRISNALPKPSTMPTTTIYSDTSAGESLAEWEGAGERTSVGTWRKGIEDFESSVDWEAMAGRR